MALNVRRTNTKLSDSPFRKLHIQNLPSKYFEKYDGFTSRVDGHGEARYYFKDMQVVVKVSSTGGNANGEIFKICASPMDGTDVFGNYRTITMDGWEQFNDVSPEDFDVDAFVNYCNEVYNRTFQNS